MDENLPKYKTSGKTGETNAPKIPVLNTYHIIGYTFLCHPKNMAKSYGSVLLKLSMNMKQS